MSRSDNARRGSFNRSRYARYLPGYYNRVDRRNAMTEIREAQGFIEDEASEDVDPLNHQPRHRALWDAF